MKVNVSDGFIFGMCRFLGEIEIKGNFVTLYQYGRRKYYLVIENNGIYEFNSRKAADEFIVKF